MEGGMLGYQQLAIPDGEFGSNRFFSIIRLPSSWHKRAANNKKSAKHFSFSFVPRAIYSVERGRGKQTVSFFTAK